MAQRTTVILTDDLTGGDADETVRFGFDGKAYSIDLSTKNADKLRKLIAPYVESGRRDGSAPPASRRSGTFRVVDPRAVRAWARSNGYEINARGRVSAEIVAAFKDAGN
jgi:hypothetical protein